MFIGSITFSMIFLMNLPSGAYFEAIPKKIPSATKSETLETAEQIRVFLCLLAPACRRCCSTGKDGSLVWASCLAEVNSAAAWLWEGGGGRRGAILPGT